MRTFAGVVIGFVAATIVALVIGNSGEPVTLRPCLTEDSSNCYWDADHRGNGLGTSFVDIDGKLYVYTP